MRLEYLLNRAIRQEVERREQQRDITLRGDIPNFPKIYSKESGERQGDPVKKREQTESRSSVG